MEKIQAKFIVKGFVQGVGFRYFVYRRAIELGISGFTKNLYDGNVEVIAEGFKNSVDELHKFLKVGPSHSHVEYIEVEYSEFSDEYKGFEIQ